MECSSSTARLFGVGLTSLFALSLLSACEGDLSIVSLNGPPPGGGGPPQVFLDSGMAEDTGGPRDGGSPDAAVPDTGSPPIGCTPMCAGRACGDDGCGGSCGTCTTGQTCGAAGQCSSPPPMSPLCPPTGSTGTSVGDIAPDVSFPLADGGDVSLRSTCNSPTMFYRFAESCGICRRWLDNNAQALQDGLAPEGFELIIVVGTVRRADGTYGPPSAADAQRIRSEYGLSVRVAYETNNEFLWTFHRSGSGTSILMTEGNVIATPIGKISDSTVQAIVGGS